ncbi:MAG: DUF2066 domain-containing protein [Rhodospirillaceae bacterium]
MLDRLGQAALAALLLFVAVSGMTAQPARAQAPLTVGSSSSADDPFSVTGVAVDVTAASAAEARDKAISEAQRKAFAVLFKRLVPDSATRVVPAVAESDLQRMIQGFEIEQERGSAVRYVASMAFKFRRKAVGTYLTSLGLKINEPAQPASASAPAAPAAPVAPVAVLTAPARPSLVLPLAQGAASSVLWEERTPWRSAWEDFAATSGAGKLVVPAGELTDIADIGAREAVIGDPASIAKIAGHYGVGQVVVVALTGADRLDPGAGAQVVISRYGADGRPAGPAETAQVPGTLGEPVPSFLGRVAAAVSERLAASSVAVAPAAAVDAPVLAGVPITGMLDWLEVRRRLTSDPMVSSVDMLAMSRTRVDVAIHYRGEVDGLRAMLDRDGLTLVPTPGGWSLYIKASVAPGAAAPAVPKL